METRTGFEVTSLFSLFTGMNYFTCEVCGNEYDKVFEVHMDGKVHVFDSFECAIQALAPTCANCGSRIIGHGMEAGGVFDCSARLCETVRPPRAGGSGPARKGREFSMKTMRKSVATKKAVHKATGTRVGEIMTRGVETVKPEDTLQIAARKMKEHDIGFLPVCSGERLVGTLSDRDIAVRAVAAGFDPRSTPIKEFATSQTVWCFEDEGVDEAARKMEDNQVRRMIVVRRDDRRLVGVVSLGDLAANGTQKLSSEVLQSVSPLAA